MCGVRGGQHSETPPNWVLSHLVTWVDRICNFPILGIQDNWEHLITFKGEKMASADRPLFSKAVGEPSDRYLLALQRYD